MTDKINGFRPNFPQTKPNAGGTRPKSYTSSTDSPIFDNPLNNATNWYSDNIQKTGVQNVATSSLKGTKGTVAGVALDSITTAINAGTELKNGNIQGAYVQASKGAVGIAGGILGGVEAGQAGAMAGSIAGENIGEQGASLHLDVLDAAKESKSAREFAGRTSNAAIDRGTEIGRGILHGVGNLLFNPANSGLFVNPMTINKAMQYVNPELASKVDKSWTDATNGMHASFDRGVDGFYDFANGAWHGAKDAAKAVNRQVVHDVGVAVDKAEKVYSEGKAVAKTVYNEGKAAAKTTYNKGKAAAKTVYNEGKAVARSAYNQGKSVARSAVNAGKSVARSAVNTGKAVVTKGANMASRGVNAARNAYNRATSWLFG